MFIQKDESFNINYLELRLVKSCLKKGCKHTPHHVLFQLNSRTNQILKKNSEL